MPETLSSSNGVDAITTSLNKNVSPLMPTLNFFKKNENQININTVRPNLKKRKIPQRTPETRTMVTLNQMHQENLIVLKNIDKNMARLADGVSGIGDDFREYLKFLKSSEPRSE